MSEGTGKTVVCKALMAEAEEITCITTNAYSPMLFTPNGYQLVAMSMLTPVTVPRSVEQKGVLDFTPDGQARN